MLTADWHAKLAEYSLGKLLLDGGGAHGGGLGWLRHAGPSGTPAG